MRNGYGTLRSTDGGVYQGDWKDDDAHGFGKLTHPSGLNYEGEFRDGAIYHKPDRDDIKRQQIDTEPLHNAKAERKEDEHISSATENNNYEAISGDHVIANKSESFKEDL